ncbi:MAG: BamA/TamA family outer membrane protein, partial [Candidatus Glassbacteria bacterium]|nr:BamA/TamA family outer membrane protein [Candidatus Glassbacteria bacterium]
YSKLLESQRKIYLTGLFQSVFIRPQPSARGDSTQKDILVELKENMSGEFNVALGYGSIEKAIGRLEVYNNNLGGTARKLGFNAEMSFINRLLGVSFSEPWTFGTPWRTDLNLTVEYKEEPGYNLDRAGGQITLGRKFDEQLNFTVTYRHEDVRLSDVQVAEIPGELSSNTRSFKFSIIYDTRDNLFNASRGTYAELSDEVGIFFADQNSLFNRLSGKYKYFLPMSDATTLATGLELG